MDRNLELGWDYSRCELKTQDIVGGRCLREVQVTGTLPRDRCWGVETVNTIIDVEYSGITHKYRMRNSEAVSEVFALYID